MQPDAYLDCSRPENTSMVKTKRYGDMGSPCLNPWVLWKNPPDCPLTDTEKEAVEMH